MRKASRYHYRRNHTDWKIEQAALPTDAPGTYPTNELPPLENSQVGTVLKVDCSTLSDGIFKLNKTNDSIVIIKFSKNTTMKDPTLLTIYESNGKVNEGSLLEQLLTGIECKVTEQRNVHGIAWEYVSSGFYLLSNHEKEKLSVIPTSKDACYGSLDTNAELVENENFFYECEASESLKDVFERLLKLELPTQGNE